MFDETCLCCGKEYLKGHKCGSGEALDGEYAFDDLAVSMGPIGVSKIIDPSDGEWVGTRVVDEMAREEFKRRYPDRNLANPTSDKGST